MYTSHFNLVLRLNIRNAAADSDEKKNYIENGDYDGNGYDVKCVIHKDDESGV
ncbi:hypothetical protein DPMN_050022 [Dreissena polymorpha]|uniref:Uncharacterized protein n=1 Tax=Dreissena polymorpha TaxID=45954 RepID=A0A9D4CGN0_DREPO|nr:hypothetical protein DPMN_050022 [Dreissena polymorpha]